MLCEKCNKKKATVFYNENINGKVRAFNLCADCAKVMKDAGELEDFSSPFASFSSPFSAMEDSFFNDFFSLPFHGTGAGASVGALTTPKKCPLCGSTLSDISAAGKVGCARCYETFAEALEAPIESAHGKTGHIGRIPRGHRARRERADRINALRKQLKASIESENFEEAARLRDQIRGLEGQA